MTIQKRVSKKGEVSYLIRVSLGYIGDQQIIKSRTWKPEKGMSPKKIEKEVNRQAVLFEEQAKQDYAEELQRKAEQMEQDSDDIEYRKRHTTFKSLAEEWIDLQEASHEMKNSSILRMKSCRERTYSYLGKVLVSKLSYHKIQKFITSLGQTGVNKKTGAGLSEKTQKHYLTFVSDVMYYAKKCRLIDENPCKDIVFVKENDLDKKERIIYSLEEAKLVLSAIDEKAPTGFKLFYNLLAYCGLRRGEALGLEYKDIDFENSILTINRTSNYHIGYGTYTDTPKTKNSYRSLYIAPKLLEMIKQLQTEQKDIAKKCGDQWQESDRLFVSWCGKPLSPNFPYKWLQRFCERENIPFHGLHAFRHFVATQALVDGVDAKSVSAMLGHSQTSTTLNIYAHAVRQAQTRALNSIAAQLESG